MSAARSYKEIVAEVSAAAEALREKDRARAAVLARQLAEHDVEMLRAGERAALTRFGVELHWEAALEALWVETWMKLRPRPGPDPSADSAEIDVYDVELEEAAARLQAAVRRRWLPGR
jgi:hypothetical protein